eukprot:8268-Pelagomonas_calceolata.AAC.6
MASLGRGLPASEKAQLRAEPGFHALARALLSGVPRMKPIQLANSLEAFASLGVIPHTEGMKAYLERCKVCAEAMNGRDLATLLHAFAIMQVRPGRKTLDTLGFRAVHLLRQGEMQPQVRMRVQTFAMLVVLENTVCGYAVSGPKARSSHLHACGGAAYECCCRHRGVGLPIVLFAVASG